MKKISFILFLAFLFSVPVEAKEPIRGLFVSMIQEPDVLSSPEAIEQLIAFSKKEKVSVLFVQVYRANRSWFPSWHADDSLYWQAKKSHMADPLLLLIQKAHAENIEVHAWLNLLSLSANENAPMLKKYGPSILTTNTQAKKTLSDYKIDQQYFLEAGDPRVHKELVAIVRELLTTYPLLDGIQFDYIRYPDWKPAYGHTYQNKKRFEMQHPGALFEESSKEWRAWKRDQVTSLLVALRKKALKISPGIKVSTTGLVPFVRAREEAFQDWKYWLESGFIDFLTLMCYADDVPRFEKLLRDAKNQLGHLEKVNIAVGAYEARESSEIFKGQLELCRDADVFGCIVLHYGNLLESPSLAEAFS